MDKPTLPSDDTLSPKKQIAARAQSVMERWQKRIKPIGSGKPERRTEEMIQEICDRLACGESLSRICQDEHIAAYRTVKRGRVDARKTVAWAQKKKGRSIYIDGLEDSTGNGISKAFLAISAAFAELGRDTIWERATSVKADQKESGRHLEGKPPFGFTVEYGALVEAEAQQEVIRKIVSIRRTKKSIRSIREMLMNEGDLPLSLAAIHRIIHDCAGMVLPPTFRIKEKGHQAGAPSACKTGKDRIRQVLRPFSLNAWP